MASMETRVFTERVLPQAFMPIMILTLSLWMGFSIYEIMGEPVDWLVVALLACALLGVAISMDAASTMRFGREMIIRLEAAPVLRVMTGRYGLACGMISQMALEVALVAGAVLLVGYTHGYLLPVHHLLAGIAVILAACHYATWRSNNRYWGWSVQ